MNKKILKAKLILSVFWLSAVSLFIGVPTIEREKLEHLIAAENQEKAEAQAANEQEVL